MPTFLMSRYCPRASAVTSGTFLKAPAAFASIRIKTGPGLRKPIEERMKRFVTGLIEINTETTESSPISKKKARIQVTLYLATQKTNANSHRIAVNTARGTTRLSFNESARVIKRLQSAKKLPILEMNSKK